MGNVKIKLDEESRSSKKIVLNEIASEKSIADDSKISSEKSGSGKSISRKSSEAKSSEAKSFGRKSSEGNPSRQNQSGKIASGEIHSGNKSDGKIDGGEIAYEKIGGEPTIWLDTLSEETRKLLVNDGTSKLHYVWAAMKQRCYNPKSRNYKWYGARGVRVCKSWLRWQNFKLWALRNGYNPEAPYGECTLDRIDVDGDYEPSNCRWVSLKEQMSNRQWNKEKLDQEKEPEPKPTSRYAKAPVVAVDVRGIEVYEFENVESAARFFRPTCVLSASSYIQRAVDHGGTSYKYHWRYKSL